MRVLVVVPTYNERDNVEILLPAVRGAVPTPTSWSSTTTARTAPATSSSELG